MYSDICMLLYGFNTRRPMVYHRYLPQRSTELGGKVVVQLGTASVAAAGREMAN